MENKINPRYYHFALIGYCLLIFILSSLPGDELPKIDIEFSDKYIHIIVFAVLCLLFFYSLKNQSKYAKLKKFAPEYSVLFTALYGITDELHQYFVPNRSCEIYDWLADLTGAILIYIIMKTYHHKRKAVTALVFMLAVISGSCGSSIDKKNNYMINVTAEEAWLNLMPGIDETSNKFGFSIDVKMENFGDNTGLAVKDLVIYLNNDTLKNKTFESQITKDGRNVMIKVFQLNSERYLDTSKPLPEEAQFSFRIYKGSNQIKKLKTSKLTIHKVY
ncbi:MAG: VanZ family protein [Ignavibacteria bacterium]